MRVVRDIFKISDNNILMFTPGIIYEVPRKYIKELLQTKAINSITNDIHFHSIFLCYEHLMKFDVMLLTRLNYPSLVLP